MLLQELGETQGAVGRTQGVREQLGQLLNHQLADGHEHLLLQSGVIGVESSHLPEYFGHTSVQVEHDVRVLSSSREEEGGEETGDVGTEYLQVVIDGEGVDAVGQYEVQGVHQLGVLGHEVHQSVPEEHVREEVH